MPRQADNDEIIPMVAATPIPPYGETWSLNAPQPSDCVLGAPQADDEALDRAQPPSPTVQQPNIENIRLNAPQADDETLDRQQSAQQRPISSRIRSEAPSNSQRDRTNSNRTPVGRFTSRALLTNHRFLKEVYIYG